MSSIVDAPQRFADDADDDAGVLLVGHGTRDAAGWDEFLAVAAALAARLSPVPVEAGFLELAEPTIAEGAERLRQRGAERIVAMPLLLFAAGHAKQDIPQALATCPTMAEHGLPWRQAEHLGLHPQIVALSALRYDEAIAASTVGSASHVDPADTLLILVGRGSTDPEALAEFRDFTALRTAARPVGRVETAFTALAVPLLPAALERAAALPYARVVVQPHLLFGGRLLDRVGEQVRQAAANCPAKQWTVTPHLGCHAAVVEAIVDRLEGR